MGPHVIIATPSYNRLFHDCYVASLIDTITTLPKHGVAVDWASVSEMSLLGLARAGLVAGFLADPTGSHLLFADADQGWRAEDVLRLMRHNLPMVCGLSPMRREGDRPFAFAAVPDLPPGAVPYDAERGLVRCAIIGMGFVLLQRAALERMVAAYPDRRLTPEEPDDPPTHDLFPIGRNATGAYCGEDNGFCRLWTAIGGEIWFDPAVQLLHVGSHTYRGDPRELFELAPR